MLVDYGNYVKIRVYHRNVDSMISADRVNPSDKVHLSTRSQKYFTLTAGETAKTEKALLTEETLVGE